MIEELSGPERNALILGTVPSVLASLAARIVDPTGGTLNQVTLEQLQAANERGLSGVEFGLVKLQAAERVAVWLIETLSDALGESEEEILWAMTSTVAEAGVSGLFNSGWGRGGEQRA